MKLYSLLLLLAAGEGLAQTPKGYGKGQGPKGAGGNDAAMPGFNLGGGLGNIAKAMGLDPSKDIASMVCETFSGSGGSIGLMGNLIGGIFGSPIGTGPDEKCVQDKSGGSGPYKAHYTEIASLPAHTIYKPQNPPDKPLPVIVWGNGFCMAAGKSSVDFVVQDRF
jgi:hypothetical protein